MTTNMLKLIMCVKRLPELTKEEFDAYWRNSHASLVRRHAAILGIRRYIQTYPLSNLTAQRALEQGRGSDRVDFDGCAELRWDSLDAHLAARKTVDGLKALQALVRGKPSEKLPPHYPVISSDG